MCPMQFRFWILAPWKILIKTDRYVIIYGACGGMCSIYMINHRASRCGAIREHNLNVHNSLN